MTNLTADEAWEQEGRVNLDMEPEEALALMLGTDLRDSDAEGASE